MNVDKIKKGISNLKSVHNQTVGKQELLTEQHDNLCSNIGEAELNQELNTKAIELLNFIQKETKEVIVDVFENIVTKALQFIHQSEDYKFELEFGQRGNLPELKFNLKTPDMQESHDIMNTRAGGSKDIIALALRFVLLEISKSPGFLFLDEPEKRLDNPETVAKMIEFIKETQRNTKRQVIIITQKQEMVDSVEDPIIVKRKAIKEAVQQVKKTRRKKGANNVL